MQAIIEPRITTFFEGIGTELGSAQSAPGALLVALTLIGVARAVLPRGTAALRLPAGTVIVAIIVFVLAVAAPDFLRLGRSLDLFSLVLSLFAISRTLFVLLVESVLVRRFAGPIPRIFRDILQAVIFTFGLFIFLRVVGVEVGSLLATSALLTAVIGLALQDTLGNVISGLAIQFQRVIEVGDWIQFMAETPIVGRVIEINWRATNILTVDLVEVVIPNSILAKSAVRNYTRPTPVSRRSIDISCTYDASPEHVRNVILNTVRGAPFVLDDPPPQVHTSAFGESAMNYTVRFFIDEFPRHRDIDSAIRDRIWYALRRAAITIPFPTRSVQLLAPSERAAIDASVDERLRILHRVDFLDALPEESLRDIAKATVTRLYATHETIIRQGDVGDEFFILHRGEVSVLAGRDGGSIAQVAKLSPGAFFGEMSLMLGETRRATVRATMECEVFVLDKHSIQPIISAHPELIEHIGGVLASRLEQLDSSLAERAKRAASQKSLPDAAKEDFLKRVRAFFST